MTIHIRDVVAFRGDRLFNGAVNVDWLLEDPERATAAAQAFVFHGPRYHGVTQEDVGSAHGHRLQDTASFASAVARRCYGVEEQPFTLAIAGYGTGKSHLALTLALLLSDPASDVADDILSALETADADLGADTRSLLREQQRPALVVTINGMRSFDLTSELTRQVISQLRARQIDASRLEGIRPRFRQAAKLVRVSNESILWELLDECNAADANAVLEALDQQDETTYARVQGFYASRGMEIRSFGGESVRDVIDATVNEYCGEGKPFARLLILFDEFGRYTEFATARSQIAGSGVLQDLFEGVQTHSDLVCMVAFIQFELNAYVQRVAPELRNEILRYVTRYQTSDKAYLSTNLETLLAGLIEKRAPEQLESWFESEEAKRDSAVAMASINRWFPQSPNYRLWKTSEQFHEVVRKGCWPLSPCTTWFLFSLAAAGKHLQERSALALLNDALKRCEDRVVRGGSSPALFPADIWSDALQQEFITSEEGGQQGSIAHAYSSVEARHGAQLPEVARKILRAIVLASKVGLVTVNREDAVEALAAFSGLDVDAVQEQTRQLEDEYNVIDWDERFQSFDILGDAASRAQFLAFVRRRVADTYDDQGKASLFTVRAAEWCDSLGDVDCDFAESNSIATREWRYRGVTATVQSIEMQLELAVDRWRTAVGVDEHRGTVIYCYVEPGRDPRAVGAEIGKQLRATADSSVQSPPPILVVLLCDEEGNLGQALAEVAVIDGGLGEEDAARFGNLVAAHRDKMLQAVNGYVEEMVRERRYVTAFREALKEARLTRVGTELFERAYSEPLPFPFDGFSTLKGNAADTCQQLITELMQGALDYDAVIAKPAKVKNRALAVLNDCWGGYTKTGAISRRPSHRAVRSVIQHWDRLLGDRDEPFVVGRVLRDCCMPPYGANAASAGLLFGLFVAPRVDRLMVVRKGEQLAVTQWLQDGIFRGRLLDLSALDDVELVSVGEVSSEWQALLDEWEHEVSHTGRISYLQQYSDLKGRIPIPPALRYRALHLEEQGKAALTLHCDTEERIDGALKRLERGHDQGDVADLSRGACQLLDIREKMVAEAPLWTDRECEALLPHVDRAKQHVIQIFERWLDRQAPSSAKPDAVGEFKYRMVRLVGENLRRLQLDEIYDKLDAKVADTVRRAEAIAEARQLVRDVRTWIEQHADAFRAVRVANVRGLRDVGIEYAKRLQDGPKRIDVPEFAAVRTQLVGFLEELKVAEDEITGRAAALWDSSISSDADLQMLASEVDALTLAFEGCDGDLADLLLMKRVLQSYLQGYQRLTDEALSWQEFRALGKRLTDEALSSFGEDEPPWPPMEVYGAFLNSIADARELSAASWLADLSAAASELDSMSAAEANQLRMRAMRAPATLTETHTAHVTDILAQANARLEELEVEGLLARFAALQKSAQTRFLELASDLVHGP